MPRYRRRIVLPVWGEGLSWTVIVGPELGPTKLTAVDRPCLHLAESVLVRGLHRTGPQQLVSLAKYANWR